MMGDKIQAKKIAKENGLPVIEGSDGGISDIEEAKNICKKIGFPVLIKASGGGGGKGMKIVNSESKFEELFFAAKSEAKKFFANDEVYIEKFFKIQDILKYKFYQEKIVRFIYTKEIALFKEDIKN